MYNLAIIDDCILATDLRVGGMTRLFTNPAEVVPDRRFQPAYRDAADLRYTACHVRGETVRQSWGAADDALLVVIARNTSFSLLLLYDMLGDAAGWARVTGCAGRGCSSSSSKIIQFVHKTLSCNAGEISNMTEDETATINSLSAVNTPSTSVYTA